VAQLDVAEDQAWLAALGVLPHAEKVSGDEFVRELIVPVSDTEEVRVTWDVTDSSVRVRHQRNGTIVCDLFREMATRLTVVGTGSKGEVIVEYGSTEWSGRARIQVLPDVVIEDSVLRS
jgi:hypothetical protein